ncbi:hypothetical protein ABK040_015158 [Willaertia magna]
MSNNSTNQVNGNNTTVAEQHNDGLKEEDVIFIINNKRFELNSTLINNFPNSMLYTLLKSEMASDVSIDITSGKRIFEFQNRNDEIFEQFILPYLKGVPLRRIISDRTTQELLNDELMFFGLLSPFHFHLSNDLEENVNLEKRKRDLKEFQLISKTLQNDLENKLLEMNNTLQFTKIINEIPTRMKAYNEMIEKNKEELLNLEKNKKRIKIKSKNPKEKLIKETIDIEQIVKNEINLSKKKYFVIPLKPNKDLDDKEEDDNEDNFTNINVYNNLIYYFGNEAITIHKLEARIGEQYLNNYFKSNTTVNILSNEKQKKKKKTEEDEMDLGSLLSFLYEKAEEKYECDYSDDEEEENEKEKKEKDPFEIVNNLLKEYRFCKMSIKDCVENGESKWKNREPKVECFQLKGIVIDLSKLDWNRYTNNLVTEKKKDEVDVSAEQNLKKRKK